MTEDTSGFYKLDSESGELLHAPNFVETRDYTLRRDRPEDREQGADGWTWCVSREHAASLYNYVGSIFESFDI